MKALVYTGLGRFDVQELPTPQAGEGRSLVRVERVAVCGSDISMTHRPPRFAGAVFGHEFAGTLVDPGGAEGFMPGDRVTALPINHCGGCASCCEGSIHLCAQNLGRGLGFGDPAYPGAFAQYVAVRSDMLRKLPEGLSFAEGALLEPLAVSVRGVRLANVQLGSSVLVTGGGAIGLTAARLAKLQGAAFVALLQRNLGKAQKALERGDVDAVFEAGDPDLLKKLLQANHGRPYDVSLECTGKGAVTATCLMATRPQGRIGLLGIGDREEGTPLLLAILKEITLFGSMEYAPADFDEAIRLVASGVLDLKPYISREIGFAEVQSAIGKLGQTGDVKLVINPHLG